MREELAGERVFVLVFVVAVQVGLMLKSLMLQEERKRGRRKMDLSTTSINPTSVESAITYKVVESMKFLKDQFIEQKADIKLYPYQKAPSDYIMESILRQEGGEIILEFARQSGKTEMVANLCTFLCVYMPHLSERWRKGFRIGIFAPGKRQADITFNRFKDRINHEELKKFGITVESSNGDSFKFSNGSIVSCITAGKDTEITGETCHLIILEECQEIGDRKLKAEIFPMGASTNATRILIGTAWFHKSYFYEAIRRYKNKSNCFIYDYLTTQKYNPLYAKYVEDEKDRYGEDSDEFRTQYMLEWILERGMLITFEQAMQCARNYEPINEFEDFVYVGLDNGKAADSTVLTIAQGFPIFKIDPNPIIKHIPRMGLKVLQWVEFLGDDYDTQFNSIMDVLKDYPRIKKFCIDATATQDMQVDRFRNHPMFRGKNIVEGVVFKLRQKDQLYKNAVSFFKDKKVTFPHGKNPSREARRFVEQWINIEKDYKGSCLNPHAPNEKGAHDDYCDSFALCAWGTKIVTNTRPMAVAQFASDTSITDKESAYKKLIGVKSRSGLAFTGGAK